MTKNIEFKIEGMSCGSCALGIGGAIEIVEGVKSAKVNFESKIAKVEFDEDKTCENHIFKAVENMNYKIIK